MHEFPEILLDWLVGKSTNIKPGLETQKTHNIIGHIPWPCIHRTTARSLNFLVKNDVIIVMYKELSYIIF